MTNVIAKPSQAPARVRADFSYRHGNHELRIFMSRIEPRHLAAIREGEAEFALIVEEPAIVLCAKFGDAVPWTAATYFAGDAGSRDSLRMPVTRDSAHEARAMLCAALVDAASGQTLAERNLTLWLDFSRALGEAILDRSRYFFNPVEHERSIARLRRRYPTDDALAASSKVRCFGSM